MAICNSENENYPFIPDVTADVVYLRLLSANDEIPTGYEAKDLDMWAEQVFARFIEHRPLRRVAAWELPFARPLPRRFYFCIEREPQQLKLLLALIRGSQTGRRVSAIWEPLGRFWMASPLPGRADSACFRSSSALATQAGQRVDWNLASRWARYRSPA